MKKISLILSAVFMAFLSYAQETIKFPSVDGVEIVADLYQSNDKDAPFILLFHQAGYSRGEYQEIAPKLNEMGFNCMAIDQRSGSVANGVQNITAQNAKKAGKSTGYTDAYQDIKAAVDYVKSNDLASGKLIIWGSSYSSSLVLKYAGDEKGVDAVLSFSPGEYFRREGKPGDFIASSAKNITCPAFITSAKSEKGSWWGIYQAINTDSKKFHLPATAGKHGSSALWKKTPGNEGYWEAVTEFLEGI